ncbi:MAG: DUF523 domain-containing protein [Sulfurovum sp.]|uniref:DUF523 domain-containing protein n=1 Tax=Sulfurovum sp. TaxID=1969726 RepID=UPI002868002E|nr:DUF523 domain-containing protein [Sulfurovum sp.]MCO4844604.1 DUF523 domain-containing protein [Sulfurovum sp.]
MKKVAISACLLGEKCRYDASDNKNETLLTLLEGSELIPFCPEDFAFGSPRPTMDLIETQQGHKSISNLNGEDLSTPVIQYATLFFDAHPDLDMFIGKDRSPSCGVCSARLYDEEKNLLSSKEAGLMAKEAKKRNIHCVDAEDFRGLV